MSQNLPGFEKGRTQTPREVLLSHEGMIQAPIVVDGLKGIDGRNAVSDEIRAGWLLGQVTSSRRWVPCKRTQAANSGAASTTLVVDNSSAFRAAELIVVGVNPAQPIVSIDYTTDTITLTSAISWSISDVVRATDGSQTCRGILLDFVKLRNTENDAPAHQSAGLLIQGAVQTPMILGDLLAIRADTGAKLGGIRFSDEHGQ